MPDAYAFWRAQIAGQQPETRLPQQPEAGFYRMKRNDRKTREAIKAGEKKGIQWEAVAIWRDDAGWQCERQFGRSPAHHDEICELFASICRNAVSEEIYRAVTERGEPWPEEVSERGPDERLTELYGETDREKAMKEAPAEIGHNSGDVAPFEIMRERVADVNAQIAGWLKEIGGKIGSDEQADKAANFSTLLAELEKEATGAHKAEKEPWLEGGRKIDAAWKPVIDLAAESKKRVKANIVTPWLVEKQRRADEAARIERERIAAERAKAEAAAKGEDAPAPAPVVSVEPQRVKAGNRDGKGVSLRTVKTTEVTDLTALAAYLAGLGTPPTDFVEACKKVAAKMLAAGVDVPGARQVSQQVAA